MTTSKPANNTSANQPSTRNWMGMSPRELWPELKPSHNQGWVYTLYMLGMLFIVVVLVLVALYVLKLSGDFNQMSRVLNQRVEAQSAAIVRLEETLSARVVAPSPTVELAVESACPSTLSMRLEPTPNPEGGLLPGGAYKLYVTLVDENGVVCTPEKELVVALEADRGQLNKDTLIYNAGKDEMKASYEAPADSGEVTITANIEGETPVHLMGFITAPVILTLTAEPAELKPNEEQTVMLKIQAEQDGQPYSETNVQLSSDSNAVEFPVNPITLDASGVTLVEAKVLPNVQPEEEMSIQVALLDTSSQPTDIRAEVKLVAAKTASILKRVVKSAPLLTIDTTNKILLDVMGMTVESKGLWETNSTYELVIIRGWIKSTLLMKGETSPYITFDDKSCAWIGEPKTGNCLKFGETIIDLPIVFTGEQKESDGYEFYEVLIEGLIAADKLEPVDP